jgi:hypothetical protein
LVSRAAKRAQQQIAIRAILHQFFTQDPTGNLIKQALPSHKNYGRDMTQDLSEMWRILVTCATSPDTGEIVCVLDALDECEKDSRDRLFEVLRDFYCNSSDRLTSSSKLKFLISGRPYDDVQAGFSKFRTDEFLRFNGGDESNDIKREISLVIDQSVGEVLSNFDETSRRKLSDRLKSMENHTYLWLNLIFDIIRNKLSHYKKLTNINDDLITDIPSDVSEAYEIILSKAKTNPKPAPCCRLYSLRHAR